MALPIDPAHATDSPVRDEEVGPDVADGDLAQWGVLIMLAGSATLWAIIMGVVVVAWHLIVGAAEGSGAG